LFALQRFIQFAAAFGHVESIGSTDRFGVFLSEDADRIGCETKELRKTSKNKIEKNDGSR